MLRQLPPCFQDTLPFDKFSSDPLVGFGEKEMRRGRKGFRGREKGK